MDLSHLDEQGQARMVDVSPKEKVRRTARATGSIQLATATCELVRQQQIRKGDVLTVVPGVLRDFDLPDLIGHSRCDPPARRYARRCSSLSL